MPAQYFLPVGTVINHTDGDQVKAGDVLARFLRRPRRLGISPVVPPGAHLFVKDASILAEIWGCQFQ